MHKRENPLREWRGSRSVYVAASELGMTERSYWLLESDPRRSKIKSNRILKIQHVTGIPMEVLVDYLTQTNTLTKESVTC